jgi:hypothetical protein
MESELLFSSDGIEITKRDGRFFIKYDAGAHMIVMREDEISSADVDAAMSSPERITQVLFRLQRSLMQRGIDPYVSNVR